MNLSATSGNCKVVYGYSVVHYTPINNNVLDDEYTVPLTNTYTTNTTQTVINVGGIGAMNMIVKTPAAGNSGLDV